MLKKCLLALITVSVLTGCNQNNNNISSSENVTAEISDTSLSESISDTDTSISSESVSVTSQTDETVIIAETQTSTAETSYTDTAVSDTTLSDTSVSQLSSETYITSEQTQQAVQNEVFSDSSDVSDINGISMHYNSEEITDECLSKISEYFISMQNCDSQKYEDMMIPLYRDYLLEYLDEQDYTTYMLLSQNYDNISEITGGDFRYNKIELKLLSSEDYEESEIPDYITAYKEQLDEISFEKDGTYISETFDNAYAFLYSIYAETNGEEYCITNKGVLSVFEIDGEYYILM